MIPSCQTISMHRIIFDFWKSTNAIELWVQVDSIMLIAKAFPNVSLKRLNVKPRMGLGKTFTSLVIAQIYAEDPAKSVKICHNWLGQMVDRWLCDMQILTIVDVLGCDTGARKAAACSAITSRVGVASAYRGPHKCGGQLGEGGPKLKTFCKEEDNACWRDCRLRI